MTVGDKVRYIGKDRKLKDVIFTVLQVDDEYCLISSDNGKLNNLSPFKSSTNDDMTQVYCILVKNTDLEDVKH